MAGTTSEEGLEAGLGDEEEILRAMVGTHRIMMDIGVVEVVSELRTALCEAQEDLPELVAVTEVILVALVSHVEGVDTKHQIAQTNGLTNSSSSECEHLCAHILWQWHEEFIKSLRPESVSIHKFGCGEHESPNFLLPHNPLADHRQIQNQFWRIGKEISPYLV
ncbi:unnamed protein product [Rhodiola kirilowii]